MKFKVERRRKWITQRKGDRWVDALEKMGGWGN
jgi:hypothetical protein